MNSLNDGIEFLNIKKNKYNEELNKVNLTQNNTSGYNSIIENLDNIGSIASASLRMNTNLNSDNLSTSETLDNTLKNKINDYNNQYKELEILINELNTKINNRDSLNISKNNLENELKNNNERVNDYNDIVLKINNINIEINELSKTLKKDIDNLIYMNNDIKNISSEISSNINLLSKKANIDPINNKLISDGNLKLMVVGIDTLKKLKNAIDDINIYSPSIKGEKIFLSEFSINNSINKYNEVKDNYKYVNINSSAMKDDSFKFNKYEKYQYIIWIIFIVIILLMVYKSITDSGPISLTTGLFSLTFLFLFYYIVTLFIK